jgi:replication initiation and membrane attachment protein DnaB
VARRELKEPLVGKSAFALLNWLVARLRNENQLAMPSTVFIDFVAEQRMEAICQKATKLNWKKFYRYAAPYTAS